MGCSGKDGAGGGGGEYLHGPRGIGGELRSCFLRDKELAWTRVLTTCGGVVGILPLSLGRLMENLRSLGWSVDIVEGPPPLDNVT